MTLKKHQIVTTQDGSKTIAIPDLKEHYHSTHGAVQEAKHVFIKNGFQIVDKNVFSILEIGFGTGLNTILTYIQANEDQKIIQYSSLEAHPLSFKEIQALEYVKLDEIKAYSSKFILLHTCKWEESQTITSFFTLRKIKEDLISFQPKEDCFDLIYFDAFGPQVQPKLWERSIFEKLYHSLKKDGVLVTYSAKGEVRRTLLSVGFKIERLPGPPGKREMLRGKK